MKLVIDIPEKIYSYVNTQWRDVPKNDSPISIMCNAIIDGTPLTKGHGDLIDRRELKKEIYTITEWNGDIHRIIYEASIDDVKPIIEADKGVLEKINEKQDSLRTTCKAWDEATEKDGYVN